MAREYIHDIQLSILISHPANVKLPGSCVDQYNPVVSFLLRLELRLKPSACKPRVKSGDLVDSAMKAPCILNKGVGNSEHI